MAQGGNNLNLTTFEFPPSNNASIAQERQCICQLAGKARLGNSIIKTFIIVNIISINLYLHF